LAADEGCWAPPPAGDPPPVASFAEGALLSALPLVPPEPAALTSLWALGVFEVTEALELELVEFELPDDPPPQPASTSAATASAREVLALAVLAGFVINCSRVSSRNA
jgi:hypothetical protein